MAERVGVSVSSVQRIWRAHGLAPHRVRQFKLSNDPAFAAKLRDVVGLYVDPPAHAVVLSVDEKSQIQALDRTQPGLPMKKGRAGTMTHDYKRNGTTTLFAALNVLDGTVIGRNMQRHRHQEFIRFLNVIEAGVPVGKIVHVILDNYAAHKHPKVLAWLARHPRFVFHFTPTSCSWSNAVETFFATLTKRRLNRGVFRSVYDLHGAINRYIEDANHDPKPFVWTADPNKIIAARQRGLDVLEPIREVWIHGERFAARRRSMMRIMARRMKATVVRAYRSKSRASRRLRLIQAKVRSTIQRLGKTSKPCAASERLTISSFQRPVRATTRAIFSPR
jgi:transposase